MCVIAAHNGDALVLHVCMPPGAPWHTSRAAAHICAHRCVPFLLLGPLELVLPLEGNEGTECVQEPVQRLAVSVSGQGYRI